MTQRFKLGDKALVGNPRGIGTHGSDWDKLKGKTIEIILVTSDKDMKIDKNLYHYIGLIVPESSGIYGRHDQRGYWDEELAPLTELVTGKLSISEGL